MIFKNIIYFNQFPKNNISLRSFKLPRIDTLWLLGQVGLFPYLTAGCSAESVRIRVLIVERAWLVLACLFVMGWWRLLLPCVLMAVASEAGAPAHEQIPFPL
jgi:hypothetical protein